MIYYINFSVFDKEQTCPKYGRLLYLGFTGFTKYKYSKV
jgi:hypothetical protein